MINLSRERPSQQTGLRLAVKHRSRIIFSNYMQSLVVEGSATSRQTYAQRGIGDFKSYEGFELLGQDFAKSRAENQINLEACHNACLTTPVCNAYTYFRATFTCVLKRSATHIVVSDNTVSAMFAGLPPPKIDQKQK